jgi:hypothetical protein
MEQTFPQVFDRFWSMGIVGWVYDLGLGWEEISGKRGRETEQRRFGGVAPAMTTCTPCTSCFFCKGFDIRQNVGRKKEARDGAGPYANGCSFHVASISEHPLCKPEKP